MNIAQIVQRGTDVLTNSQTIGFEIKTFTKIMGVVGTSDGNFIRIIGGIIRNLKIWEYFLLSDIRNQKFIILSELFSESNLPLVERQIVGLSVIRYFLGRFYLFFLGRFAFWNFMSCHRKVFWEYLKSARIYEKFVISKVLEHFRIHILHKLILLPNI